MADDSPTASNLQKALIQRLDREGTVTEEISVRFNPTQYQLDKTVSYQQQSLPGFSSPITQFVSGQAETLSMELLFDTTDREPDAADVRAAFTDKLDDLLTVDGTLHAPPVCRFVWGKLEFRAVLQSASKSFTMFAPDGTPVRARVSVTFAEYNPPDLQRAKEPRESADRTTARVVTQGDTLPLLAAREYGDPTRWRPIADANGIVNPRTVAPGRELLVPPLPPAAGSRTGGDRP